MVNVRPKGKAESTRFYKKWRQQEATGIHVLCMVHMKTDALKEQPAGVGGTKEGTLEILERMKAESSQEEQCVMLDVTSVCSEAPQREGSGEWLKTND